MLLSHSGCFLGPALEVSEWQPVSLPCVPREKRLETETLPEHSLGPSEPAGDMARSGGAAICYFTEIPT